jgi:hypothetical protein
MQPNAGILILIATLVGFFGDLGTQIAIKLGVGGEKGLGLKEYFAQHGKVESLFIAAGIMAVFYSVYALTNLPFTILYMIIYSIILDLLFRYLRIFPSLDKFYQNSVPSTLIFGAIIPFVLPILILKITEKLGR